MSGPRLVTDAKWEEIRWAFSEEEKRRLRLAGRGGPSTYLLPQLEEEEELEA